MISEKLELKDDDALCTSKRILKKDSRKVLKTYLSAIRSWINCGSNDVPAGAWCARARRVDATVDIRGRMVVKMEELNMAFYDV